MAHDPKTLTLASPRTVREFVSSVELAAPAAERASILSKRSRAPGDQDAFSLRAPFGVMFDARSVAEPSSLSGPVKQVSGADADGLGVEAGMDQAYLVGSQIVSFNEEVTPERRAAAVNSCLLAQLRASKLHPSRSTPSAAYEWHAAYVNTLTNLGWVLQGGVETRQAVGQAGATLDKALLEIASALLGGGGAAALAGKVLGAVTKLQEDDPFITLYSSRTVEQQMVSFGASIGSGAGRGFYISVVECSARVRSEREQVLFFKWDSGDATLDGRRYDLSLADAAYEGGRAVIEAKIADHVRSYVARVEI